MWGSVSMYSPRATSIIREESTIAKKTLNIEMNNYKKTSNQTTQSGDIWGPETQIAQVVLICLSCLSCKSSIALHWFVHYLLSCIEFCELRPTEFHKLH